MYQKTIIVGNLGRDPESKPINGQNVTNFSVATNRTHNGVKETLWFRVSVWGKQGESCKEYLKRGSQVLVEGRLTGDSITGGPRIWTDKNGKPSASFEMIADNVRFLSGKDDTGDKEETEGLPF